MKNIKTLLLLVILLFSQSYILLAQFVPRTYLNVGWGGKHTLDYYNDPANQLHTTGLGLDFDLTCRCGNQTFQFGVLQELNQKYALQVEYQWHYKFLNLTADKPFLIESYGDRQYLAEKTSIKLYRTWQLNKHWQWNIGIGYRVLWNKIFQNSYKPPFPSTYSETSVLPEMPLAEEQINQGYQQLAFSSLTQFNKYPRYHLLTASTALEYKLRNHITFFIEAAADKGFQRISTTKVAYTINNGAINEAEVWDKGNVLHLYLGTKLPIDWLWRNGYVKELFKK
jgi:hypothetical protein